MTKGLINFIVPVLVAAAGCVDYVEEPELGEDEEELFKTDAFGWSRDANGVTTTVPICWDERDYVNLPDPTMRTAFKDFVRRTIEETWQRESALIFSGWGDCHSGSGGTLGINLHMSTSNRGITYVIHPAWEPQHADVHLPVSTSINHRRYTTIHEVGHALGLAHEQARPDNNGRCDEFDEFDWATSAWPGDILTPWDWRSVMNYCAPQSTELSPLDVMGIQRVYGRKPGPSLVSSRGLCVGTSGTSVIPTRCSSGALVGGFAPGGDWLRLRFNIGSPLNPVLVNGFATAPSSTGTGALTMTTASGNANWDRYTLENVTIRGLAGRKLRASGGFTAPNTPVITWDDSTIGWATGAVAGERWTFMADGTIRGAGGQCLDVVGANPSSGTPVQMYPCNGSAAQRWSLSAGDTIRSQVTTAARCLEVNRNETDTTTAFPTTQAVRIATCNGTLRQQWSVRGAVTSADGVGCLSVPASGAGSVSQANCSSATEQMIDVHW